MWGTYVFDESTLVLEGVTLGEVIQLVVEVLVDLAGSAVLDEETAEDTETAHPEDLAVDICISTLSLLVPSAFRGLGSPLRRRIPSGCVPGHTGVLGTLPLTETPVATDAAGSGQGSGAGARVHRDGLADDEAIVNQLADGLAGIGVGDLVDLVGVEPDLALSATDNGRRKALLRAEIDPTTWRISMRIFVVSRESVERSVKGVVERGVPPRCRRLTSVLRASGIRGRRGVDARGYGRWY
jgi:hypothetical protein